MKNNFHSLHRAVPSRGGLFGAEGRDQPEPLQRQEVLPGVRQGVRLRGPEVRARRGAHRLPPRSQRGDQASHTLKTVLNA